MITVQNGITIGEGISIGQFRVPLNPVTIVEEDLTTLIVTELGQQIIEEY